MSTSATDRKPVRSKPTSTSSTQRRLPPEVSSAPERARALRLEPDLDVAVATVDALVADLGARGVLNETAGLDVAIALREALANAIFHGTLELPPPSFDMDDEVAERVRAELASRRGREPYASRRVTLYVVESDAAVTLVVEDEGPGYDPSAIPDPTESTSLRATGRGIFLMRELMDDLRFEDEGRRVTLVKRRGPA